jgi:hypothetical protein
MININRKVLLTGLLLLLFGVSAVFGQTVRLEASKAENIGSYRPNSLGVYPVRLRWQKPADDESRSCHVYRSVRQDTGFERISSESALRETSGFITFIDENSSAVPGRPYYYRVMLVNSEGEAAPFSETVMGYGAVTPEAYIREFTKTVKSSHTKLTYMHKSGSLSKLGKEQKPGTISGTLSYDAQRVGLGGRVIMQYDRYADFYIDNNRGLGPYFTLSGNMNTTASMNQSGTMDGTVTISGMYPGRIHYDKLLIKDGKAGGGTIGIEPQGFSRTDVRWTLGE